ncbi:hypothetical protein LRR81_12740 [Metabacillus sp. GX 13764]|uniref:hypothetical protein n=1 Tax=Metabacillus kandeliae TaxID=2900151 RepID=UPI001E6086A5|nr:hypothetical protein [Metabacillus kandeliae]MCD7035107.1 hypothetical protein [Metabacillus kandeliae]
MKKYLKYSLVFLALAGSLGFFAGEVLLRVKVPDSHLEKQEQAEKYHQEQQADKR